MKNTLRTILAAALALSVLPARADWPTFTNHAPPFTYRFGNDFDTHQQTRLGRDGMLRGFFFITYTGEVTPDGYPVAHHCDAQTPPEKCVAGWILRGWPASATFLYQNMDHPVWLTSRSEIPQPGAPSHFHWITSQGTDKRPVPAECEAATDMSLVQGAVCPGWFLELIAVSSFAFEHHGQRLLVNPGIDLATHLNLLTSAPPAMPMGGGM